MKIGILQTAPNNCAFLNSLCRKSGVQLVNFVDEAVWEVVLNSGGQVTERVHDILAEDFMRLIEAGCDSIGLLCSLVKPGIEKVREKVPMPIIVYDDVQAERAVAVTPEGGKIAVIAMKDTPLEPSKKAVLEASVRAEKNIAVETICVESAKNCLAETGSEALADEYFIRYLRENRDRYSAFVIPQVPLSRIMVKIRDLKTPVFDSMEPFVDKLINGACSGLEAGLIKK